MKTLFKIKKLWLKRSKELMIWQIILPLLVVANISYLIGGIVGSIITLSFFLFAPGYLFLNLLKHELKSKWEIGSFSMGISLLSIMLGGLCLNTLNIFGLSQPLTSLNIFLMLNLFVISLLWVNRKKKIKIPKLQIKASKEQLVIAGLLTFLPFLAAGGATTLNNGGSNTLTMILFALIPIVFIILVARKNLQSLYPYAIFTMALAILFSTSLRGWYITGHDIQHEFSVFQHTYQDNLWHVRVAMGDPYNACLSITILPTIIAKITTIPSVYVYKFFFQIIFAFGLMPVYLFVRKFTNSIYGLIAAFIFITFPTFLDDMPFLNRQEIGFIFFGLLVMLTFSKIKKGTKMLLSVAILLGIMFSHYSSNYVTLCILLGAWFIFNLLKRTQTIKNNSFEIPILRLWIIVGAIILTFLWNSQITASASNLETAVIQTIDDFRYKRSVEDRFLSYGLIERSVTDLKSQFEEFVKTRSISAQYTSPSDMPLTYLGQKLSSIIDVKSFNYGIHTAIAKIYQVLIILGTVIYFFKQRRTANKEGSYYISIIFAGLILLVTFTLFPRLASDYSVIRLIQQTLVLTALPIIFATEFLFGLFRRYKQIVVAVLFVVLFLHSSGFVPQLTGGYKPLLALNNAGVYYDYFYTHESDLLSTNWLAENMDKSLPVFHDVISDLSIINYPRKTGLLYSDNETRQQMSLAYIYLGYTNTTKGIFRTFQIGDFTEYIDTSITLNRNLIYNNGKSRIYLGL
ncbi:MAG TPA: DUF2206 domain-containing protein [Patescibacteria group bacterium]|nr:DUF2206 domain-containing protein [Patescibacteria group bacterium]